VSSNPVFIGIYEALLPDPYITIDKYADEYRMLPKESSAEPGKYRSDRMPYLKEVMQWLSPQDSTQQVKIIKGTQIGATEVGNNVSLYYMDIVPAPQTMILPSETLAKKHSNKKLTPSLRVMPHIAKKITGGKTKDDIGGTFEKIYPGGSLNIGWAGSAISFRSDSSRIVILDDVDGFPLDVEGEGDPLDLGKKRADAFGSLKKVYINSTPTVKGRSNIEIEYEDSDQRRYYMPCPHCTPKDHEKQNKDNMVVFEDEHFRFEYDKYKYTLTSDVKFCCYHCGTLIEEKHKTWMMDQRNGARTIADNAGHPHKGLRIPSYYSPIGFLGWNEIFQEKLTAKKAMKRGDTRKMKTWVNTRDARPWQEDELKDIQMTEDALYARRETYKAEVPADVYILHAGVDTQDDRFEYEVVGYGKNGKTWGIERGVIVGDPSLPDTKIALDAVLLEKTYKHESGSIMKIHTKTVDYGGHRGKAVSDYTSKRYHRRVFAIKGAKQVDAPVVNKVPTKTKYKTKLFMVGVNAAKDDFFSRLILADGGDNYCHFPVTYDKTYFDQIVVEKQDDAGRWINPPGKRNESTDCRIYADCAKELSGIDVEKMPKPMFHIENASPKKRRRILSRR